MQEFTVVNSFIVGEIDRSLRVGDIVYFDGNNLLVSGIKYVAPGVYGAIGAGWLVPTGEEISISVTKSSRQDLGALEKRLNPQQDLSKFEVQDYSFGEQVVSGKERDRPIKPLLNISMEVTSDGDRDYIPIAPTSEKGIKNKAKGVKKPSMDMPVYEVEGQPIPSEGEIRGVNIDTSIPDMPVIADGEQPKFSRQPKKVAKKDTHPKESANKAPTEPKDMHSSEVFTASTESVNTGNPLANLINVDMTQEHVNLAKNSGFEVMGVNSTGKSDPLPGNWKSMPWAERKAFIDEASEREVLEQIKKLETGALKKFISSKLETMK